MTTPPDLFSWLRGRVVFPADHDLHRRLWPLALDVIEAAQWYRKHKRGALAGIHGAHRRVIQNGETLDAALLLLFEAAGKERA